MREIKFRAWDKLYSRMRRNGFSVCANGDPVGYFTEPDITPNTTRIYGEWRGDSTMILMQYTGLHDKNGNEIYEGDIVYLDGHGEYLVEWPFDQLYQASREHRVGKIKGNPYENPELF